MLRKKDTYTIVPDLSQQIKNILFVSLIIGYRNGNKNPL